MKIIKLHSLNREQKQEVEDLVAVCLEFDQLTRVLYLENDLNFYENLDSFFLLYDANKLVSVLTIVQSCMEEAEISAYTLPEYRRKGCFRELLYEAADELEGFEVAFIHFIIEPSSQSGIMAAKAFQGSYKRSEYLLELNLLRDGEQWSEKADIFDEPGLEVVTLRKLGTEELQTAVKLHQNIFDNSFEEAEYIVSTAMDGDNMECYGYFYKQEMIGLCNISYSINTVSIFGLGIIFTERGKGYGKSLLYKIIKLLKRKEKKKLTLQVASESQAALGLYKSIGFQVKLQYDYYIVSLEDI